MTDMKKTAEDKAPAKGRKLQLHKETLKDLNTKKEASPKGGVGSRGGDHVCSFQESGCI